MATPKNFTEAKMREIAMRSTEISTRATAIEYGIDQSCVVYYRKKFGITERAQVSQGRPAEIKNQFNHALMFPRIV